MAAPIAGTLFNSNGGGGTFYQGRGGGQGGKRREEEARPELDGDALALAADGVSLPAAGPRSRLVLGAALPGMAPVDPEAVIAELESAIKQKMALLNITVSRLERDYARRARAEIGEMLIGA